MNIEEKRALDSIYKDSVLRGSINFLIRGVIELHSIEIDDVIYILRDMANHYEAYSEVEKEL